MKSNKLTSLLCALALTGAALPLSMVEAAEPALPAPAATQEAPAESVNYTDALMKGLSLTLPDVQSAVEASRWPGVRVVGLSAKGPSAMPARPRKTERSIILCISFCCIPQLP